MSVNRASQLQIFVSILSSDAEPAFLDDNNSLNGLVRRFVYRGAKLHPDFPNRLFFIPGSFDNEPQNGNINSAVRDQFLVDVPLSTAITQHTNPSSVRLDYYPWYLRLTDAQYNGDTPVYMPRSTRFIDPNDEGAGTRQATWAEWLSTNGTPRQIDSSTDWKCGNMANYGFDVDLGIADSLQGDSYNVIDEATASALVLQ